MTDPTPETRTVRIPACDQHEGHHALEVRLYWHCPVCGGPRGEPWRGLSFDGSRRLGVDQWRNLCEHVDRYANVRIEAGRPARGDRWHGAAGGA